MKVLFYTTFFYFVACGSGSGKKNNVVIGNPDVSSVPISETRNTEPVTKTTVMPNGAVTANYKADQIGFYGYVSHIDNNKGITTIAFENNNAPSITLNERYGATLSMLRFKEFDSDLLLVDTRIKDPQFHKYHLYILKNGQWLPVVKPFAIHESHTEAQQNPIMVDPENPNNMFRYYSVFDIDDTDDQDYGWRLHNERVVILNK